VTLLAVLLGISLCTINDSSLIEVFFTKESPTMVAFALLNSLNIDRASKLRTLGRHFRRHIMYDIIQ
jgi:hypothetical protein